MYAHKLACAERKNLLNLLQKAENLEEENYTQRLIDFLLFYFKKAGEKTYRERNHLIELDNLKAEFTSSLNIAQYHFLGHISIQNLVRGRFPHELKFENIELAVLYPSIIIESHFKYNINIPVLKHKDSDGIEVLMGYDKLTVLNEILERGKTKFDENYEGLVPSDKVLLYCARRSDVSSPRRVFS
jgi:hypothetical protein